MKTNMGSRGTAPLILSLGTKNGQLYVPAALYPGKNPDTYWIEGWMGPRAGLDVFGREKSPSSAGIVFCVVLYSVLHPYLCLCLERASFCFGLYIQHKHPCSRRDFYFWYLLVLCTSSVLGSLSLLSSILSFCIHLKHTTPTSMPPAGLEPAIPASDRPQTLAFRPLATGVGRFEPHIVQLTS